MPTTAQAAKQAEIDARRAILNSKDYSVEEDTSKNENSKGQQSIKRKRTTKEVRAAAVIARQGLVGPSDLTKQTNNVTSSLTKDWTSQKNVSPQQGMSMSTPAEGERVTGTAATTSRKKSKSNAAVNINAKPRLPMIGPGKRCKMKRKHVYPLLEVGTEARTLVDSFDNREYNFYGIAVSKQPHNIWKVKLDVLPMSENEVSASREHIVMVAPGDGEKKFDREQSNAEDGHDEEEDAESIRQRVY